MNTKLIPEQAFDLVMPAIRELFDSVAKRKTCHIVIMDPKIKFWDVASFEDAIWWEHSIVDGSSWEHDYKKIARSKAEQMWRSGQSDGVINQIPPALLMSGDTFYSGAFNYYGVIVACSGIESYFDMLISAWIAIAIQQLSQHYIEKHQKAYPKEDFMP